LLDSISIFLGDILKFFYQITGNYAYSIILFTFAIKLSLLYFTNQQYKSMKDMQKIQPEMKKLQAKYKGEPEKLNQKMMELWKTNKVNPLGGCLPLIIQMPIIYALYKTIDHFKVEFAGAKFLWIGCMPAEQVPKFTFMGEVIPLLGNSLATPDLPLVIIYGLSMYLSQMITMSSTPQTGFGAQKSTAIFMSIFITFIMYKFQSALILYWLVFNLLSIVQQYIIMNLVSKEDVVPNMTDVVEENKEEIEKESKKTEILENTAKKKKRKK
jgi:YidC/Oxa1 family membrane protein insertase